MPTSDWLRPRSLLAALKRGPGWNHLYAWLAISVVPMFLSLVTCAGYNDLAIEGKGVFEVLGIVLATQAGPFVGLVADPETNRALVFRYAQISGAMLVVSLASFFFIKPSPSLFWKVVAWVFYLLAVGTWFVLGQVALRAALS